MDSTSPGLCDQNNETIVIGKTNSPCTVTPWKERYRSFSAVREIKKHLRWFSVLPILPVSLFWFVLAGENGGVVFGLKSTDIPPESYGPF